MSPALHIELITDGVMVESNVLYPARVFLHMTAGSFTISLSLSASSSPSTFRANLGTKANHNYLNNVTFALQNVCKQHKVKVMNINTT